MNPELSAVNNNVTQEEFNTHVVMVGKQVEAVTDQLTALAVCGKAQQMINEIQIAYSEKKCRLIQIVFGVFFLLSLYAYLCYKAINPSTTFAYNSLALCIYGVLIAVLHGYIVTVYSRYTNISQFKYLSKQEADIRLYINAISNDVIENHSTPRAGTLHAILNSLIIRKTTLHYTR